MTERGSKSSEHIRFVRAGNPRNHVLHRPILRPEDNTFRRWRTDLHRVEITAAVRIAVNKDAGPCMDLVDDRKGVDDFGVDGGNDANECLESRTDLLRVPPP